MKQGSPEWHEARRGCITASRFADAMSRNRQGTDLSGTATSYLYELIGEHLSGTPVAEINSHHLRWGNNHEPIARDAYGLATGRDPDEVGFVLHPEHPYIGCSPDGLVGDDGYLEMKCPSTTREHVRTLVSRQVPRQYIPQIQGGMWVTGRQWCHFVSFDPRLEYRQQLIILTVDRDQEFLDKMVPLLVEFETILGKHLIDLEV